jgi:hypothetical protein
MLDAAACWLREEQKQRKHSDVHDQQQLVVMDVSNDLRLLRNNRVERSRSRERDCPRQSNLPGSLETASSAHDPPL